MGFLILLTAVDPQVQHKVKRVLPPPRTRKATLPRSTSGPDLRTEKERYHLNMHTYTQTHILGTKISNKIRPMDLVISKGLEHVMAICQFACSNLDHQKAMSTRNIKEYSICSPQAGGSNQKQLDDPSSKQSILSCPKGQKPAAPHPRAHKWQAARTNPCNSQVPGSTHVNTNLTTIWKHMKSTSLNHFKAFQPSPGYGNLLSIQAVALFPQRRYARYALCVVASQTSSVPRISGTPSWLCKGLHLKWGKISMISVIRVISEMCTAKCASECNWHMYVVIS